MESIFVSNAAKLTLPFIALVVTFVTLIIGLDCIWRMEKTLRTFMIFLTLGVAAVGIRTIFLILGFDASPYWYNIAQVLDIVKISFFFLAFTRMYKIVRYLDHETKIK